jgi:glycosyltransferase involved in cell wall biosynthesis
MRVLIVIFEQLIPISGGGTPRISSIIDVLVKKGHQVSVAASFAPNTSESLRNLGCDRVVRLKHVSRLDRNKMSKYLFFHPLNLFKVFREAIKFKPDLIITHNSIPGLAAILAKKVTKVPVVIDMTDLIFEYLSSYESIWSYQLQRIGSKMENYVLHESDKIITISRAMKILLINKGAQKEKVDIVYDGVKSEIFRPHPEEARMLREKYAEGIKNIVMHHGVIDPQDNPQIIVETAAHVIKEHPSTMFWIIGDGAAIPDIKKKVRKEGLEKQFFFSGWVPFEYVPRYISASDLGLVILPDISSARIRVTLKGFEYWACGKPIIASDLPALREIVEPWKTGLFYKSGDPKDLAEKTCILLQDKDMSKEMGEAGQKLVDAKYSWAKLATQFVDICEGML